jgi:ribose 5-phosphate isomerase A
MAERDAAKRAAAEWAANRVVGDTMIVGLGTGSTAEFAIRRLGERVREGLRITGVPTSLRSEQLAVELGIPLTTLGSEVLDVTIDGADEIDPHLDLVKGAGGALLREKVVAQASKRLVIVADESKLVARLATRYPVPIEVAPFAVEHVRRQLRWLGIGAETTLRLAGDGHYRTDNGNCILDTTFSVPLDPIAFDAACRSIAGVVEHGLFLGIAKAAVIGSADGSTRLLNPTPR